MKAPFMQDLLEPISAAEPSGKDIRYDPLIDTIREARSEDDGSLPMGDWERQAKRADYSLVASLATDALQTRSKDLWLAAWLGEAWLRIEQHHGIAPALHLLLALQQEFWLSLHPEIEDNDFSTRAAPLYWSLDRYAALLHGFPATSDGVSYAAYKAVRSGLTPVHNSEELTAERLDGAIAATPGSFYAGIKEQISLSLKELHEFQLFCEERYGDEGPSFVKLRSTLDEMHHAITQLLRSRPEHEMPSEPVEVATASQVLSGAPELEPLAASVADSPVAAVWASALPAGIQDSGVPTSWDDAMNRVASCASYLIEQQPESPASYLLALALQQGRDGSQERAVPSTERRVALKQAREAENWGDVLVQSLRAMLDPGTTRWLDVHYHTWQAAENLGSGRLQALVMAAVNARLAGSSTWPQESFDDDTPVASVETQRWVQRHLNSRRATSITEAESAPVEAATTTESDDIVARAREAAARGETEQAVGLLMESTSMAQSGRDRFLRRMEVCRVCMQADQKHIAAHMLRHMLAEADELRLEHWEGRALPGTLLSMLLNATDGGEVDAEERGKLLARLCKTDPARALALQMAE